MTGPKTAVVLINLGSPDSATPKAVRKYLAEFLSDRHVVEIAPWIWWFVLHGVILPFYAKRSAEKYQKIWSAQGSPLVTLTKDLAKKLEQQLQIEYSSTAIQVKAAMRYGSSSLDEVLDELSQQSVKRVILLPLYPQYARSTTGSTVALIHQCLKKYFFEQTKIIDSYYSDKNYIAAISQTISHYIAIHGKPEQLIFSFHGLPQRSHAQKDSYLDHCKFTVDAVSQHLKLLNNDVAMTFQSRFGPAKWLQPYTQQYLESLPRKGINRVAVICPGFAVDCLETLEEINMYNRSNFMIAGGIKFDYIPALNASDQQVNMLCNILRSYLNKINEVTEQSQ